MIVDGSRVKESAKLDLVGRVDLSLNLVKVRVWQTLPLPLLYSSILNKTMKLTPELLAQAQSHLNPVKERQLDLRG